MRASLTALVLLLFIAGCSSGGDDSSSEPEPPGTPSPSSAPEEPTAEPTPADPPVDTPPDQTRPEIALVRNELIQFGASSGFAARPGSESVFVAQLDGIVHEMQFSPDRSVLDPPRVVLDISERVVLGGERGLLGIAFSPSGDRLYAVFSNDNNENELASWAIDGTGSADPGSELNHMLVTQPEDRHNGGQIVFGPDGFLYYALGDGSTGEDPLGSGQDLSTVLGSVLRIDPDPVAGGYRIPADNPFVDTPGAAAEIWLHGVRNPWRFSFDAETGDLWVADVGEHEAEEINFLPVAEGGGNGANLGWVAFEGSIRFSDVEAPGHLPPALEYSHEDGRCAVVGGFVYRGDVIPELRGSYLYSDLCDGVVRAYVPGVGSRPISDRSAGAYSFGEGPDRELYVLDANNVVSRLEAAP